jgi:hypothetical protein
MGSKSDYEHMQPRPARLLATSGALRSPRRLGAPHAGLDVRVRRVGRSARAEDDHRGRRRRGAPAGDGRRQDAGPGAGRPVPATALNGHRRPAVHRADAGRRPRRDAGHRQARARSTPRSSPPRSSARFSRRCANACAPGARPTRRRLRTNAPVSVILPGATIGILGGGQLGRMTGMAARTLGYDVHVLDPDPRLPGPCVASRTITAPLRRCRRRRRPGARLRRRHARDRADRPPCPRGRGALAPLRPGAEAVYTVQDAHARSSLARAAHFPLGRSASCRGARPNAPRRSPPSARPSCKAAMGGYDGRGQCACQTAGRPRGVREAQGAVCVVEQFLDLDTELSVLVARRADGVTRSLSAFAQPHVHGVLTGR